MKWLLLSFAVPMFAVPVFAAPPIRAMILDANRAGLTMPGSRPRRISSAC